MVTYNYSAIAIKIDMLAWERPIVCSAHILQQRLTTKKNIERLCRTGFGTVISELKLDSKMRETDL